MLKIVRLLATAIFALLVVPLVAANVELLAKVQHWDEFLKDFWPYLPSMAAIQTWWWFWVAFGLTGGTAAALWLVQIDRGRLVTGVASSRAASAPPDNRQRELRFAQRAKNWLTPESALSKLVHGDLVTARREMLTALANADAKLRSVDAATKTARFSASTYDVLSNMSGLATEETPAQSAAGSAYRAAETAYINARVNADYADQQAWEKLSSELADFRLIAKGFPVLEADAPPEDEYVIPAAEWRLLKFKTERFGTARLRAVAGKREYEGICIAKIRWWWR